MSFRNIVEYHKDELLKIMNGTRARELFTEHQYLRLKRHGVLLREPGGKYIKPTPKAMAILEGQQSSGSETQ